MAVSDIPPKFVEHFYVAQHKNILNIFVSAVGSIHESTDSNGRCLFILFDIILMYLHFKNKSNKFKYTSILAVATPRVLPCYAHSVIQRPYEYYIKVYINLNYHLFSNIILLCGMSETAIPYEFFEKCLM